MRARPRRISRCVSNSRYGTLRFLALLCGLPWAAGQAQYAPAGALRGGTAGIGADVCPLAAPEAGSASMCGRPLSGLGRTDRYAPHDAHATAWSIVTSAVVPGTGQALLRVDRFLPYLAFEAYSWIQYAAHSRTARDRRDAYRQLAARVARSPFSVVTPTGDWPYYERMEHFPESGRLNCSRWHPGSRAGHDHIQWIGVAAGPTYILVGHQYSPRHCIRTVEAIPRVLPASGVRPALLVDVAELALRVR